MNKNHINFSTEIDLILEMGRRQLAVQNNKEDVLEDITAVQDYPSKANSQEISKPFKPTIGQLQLDVDRFCASTMGSKEIDDIAKELFVPQIKLED